MFTSSPVRALLCTCDVIPNPVFELAVNKQADNSNQRDGQILK